MTNEQEIPTGFTETGVLVKIGEHFIQEKNIRSVARFGKGCKVFLTNGEELLVDLDYSKLAGFLGKK